MTAQTDSCNGMLDGFLTQFLHVAESGAHRLQSSRVISAHFPVRAVDCLDDHPRTDFARLERLKATRDNDAVRRALDRLQAAARSTSNVMPPILEAVRAYATVGEMCDALRDVWGEYEEVPII